MNILLEQVDNIKREQLVLKRKNYRNLIVIRDIVATITEVPSKVFISKERKRDIVDARHICMVQLAKRTSLTNSFIGAGFNGDHSMVNHAHKKYNELYGRDAQFTRYANDIDTILDQMDITKPNEL